MAKIKEPIYLLTATAIVLLLGIITCSVSLRKDKVEYPVTKHVDPLDVDPYPETKLDEAVLEEQANGMSDEQLKLIGRLSEGILKVKTFNNEIIWWECGKRYDKDEVEERAIEWSYIIVKYSHEYNVNPWGIAGTIQNESKFDRCTIGKYPREDAEKRGYVTPNKLTLSRDKKEIIEYLESGDWKASFRSTGMDLGGLQTLTRFIPELELYEFLSLDPGLIHQIAEMKNRSYTCPKSDRPWMCWPGYYAPWYDKKVVRYARRLGASKNEI